MEIMKSWKLKDWLLLLAMAIIIGLSYSHIRQNTPKHVWYNWDSK